MSDPIPRRLSSPPRGWRAVTVLATLLAGVAAAGPAPGQEPPETQAVAAITESPAEADTLYGALILATNDANPGEPPPALRPLARQLGAFGYNHFRLLGEKRKAVPRGTEDWLVSSRQFWLRVDTRSRLPESSGYALSLQLFQDDRMLVEVDAKLRRERPLFIRGPMLGSGQLIVLLMVM